MQLLGSLAFGAMTVVNVTVFPLAADSETVNVSDDVPDSAVPSITLASPIVTVGAASSFVIVPVTCGVLIPAPLGLNKFNEKVSSSSLNKSPLALTVI